MIVARLSGRNRIAIPAAVRRALGLRAGDRVAFTLRGNLAILTKAGAPRSEDRLFAAARSLAMRDWDTPEDDEAFREL